MIATAASPPPTHSRMAVHFSPLSARSGYFSPFVFICYELLFPQLLSFQNYLRCPLVCGSLLSTFHFRLSTYVFLLLASNRQS
jgi:hypothetical protein